jgi:hypothetical protein
MADRGAFTLKERNDDPDTPATRRGGAFVSQGYGATRRDMADHNEEVARYVERMGLQPIDDKDYDRKFKKADEIRARPNSVLPSHEFWDRWGSSDPGWQDRMGKLQAGLVSGLDALSFGAALPALRRAAPSFAERLDGLLATQPDVSKASALTAAVVNPANKVFRALGDRLAARGAGLAPQAAADGATAAGVYSLAPFIESGGLDSKAIAMAPAAALSRPMLPYLPQNMLGRTAAGAATGGAVQLPQALTNPHAIAEGVAMGAMHGAGLKPTPKDKANSKALQELDQWIKSRKMSSSRPSLGKDMVSHNDLKDARGHVADVAAAGAAIPALQLIGALFNSARDDDKQQTPQAAYPASGE